MKNNNGKVYCCAFDCDVNENEKNLILFHITTSPHTPIKTNKIINWVIQCKLKKRENKKRRIMSNNEIGEQFVWGGVKQAETLEDN
jgi:hypothetical protein